MATYILTINGVERDCRLGSLNWQAVVNGRDVLSCDVVSVGAAYRPTVGHEVVLSEDGTDVFGGIIDYTEESKASPDAVADDIVTRITARAFNIYADRRYVTETVADGTSLKTFVTTLVDDYLSDYGVTLDAAQVDGPSLEAWQIDGVLLSSVLDSLSTMTGYVWEIDASKEFRMFLPGTVAAPSDIVDGDGHHVGDIRVKRTRQNYVNRVIVKYGQNLIVPHQDDFTGDGSEDTFELTYPIAGPIPYSADGAVGYAVVDIDGGTESLGGLSAPAGFLWEYDPTAQTVTRRSGAVTNGVTFSVRYDVQYPQSTSVEDAGEIAANGVVESVVTYPDIYDQAVAEALATSLLSRGLSVQVEAEYQTYEVGIQPGQTQTITSADRNIDDTFLVAEVTARSDTNSQDIIRTVRAIGGTEFTGSFRDVYRAWLGGGTSGATSTTTPAYAGGSGVPGEPNMSVQFNRSGTFGGDADFTWDEASKNFVAGDGCTIADGSRACTASGYDCHIGGAW